MKLYEYVNDHAIRGACQCGKCFDAVPNPEKHQPIGHTADLMFFKVAAKNQPSKEEFEKLAKAEFPQWFDGEEHSYLNVGADMGDQGIALVTMGLGSVLGVWKLLTPDALMSFLPDDVKKQMAGQGYITIKIEQEKEKPG